MYKKSILLVIAFFFATNSLFAHVVVKELEQMSRTDTALLYLELGYKHILPLGFDHILFVLSLFLLSANLRIVLWQSLAFTIAHSLTLAMAMYQVVEVSPKIVEPLIALSIVFVALQNIFTKTLKPSRIGIVFLFGLVHGLGFAGVLSELGLPKNAYMMSLLTFNIGVELGQLSVILLAYFLFGKWFSDKPFYQQYIVNPLSILISMTAFYWVIERSFF